MTSYSSSKVYQKCNEMQSAKSHKKISNIVNQKLNNDNKDLIISRTTAQSTSQSQLMVSQFYNSPIANLSVAQIEKLLLKYASQNEKLSKQRHALFQKNCQLASQLKNLRGRQYSFDNQAILLSCDMQNKNGIISSFNIPAENFSLSHAIDNRKYAQQTKFAKVSQTAFEKQSKQISPAVDKFYSSKDMKQKLSSKVKQNNKCLSQLDTSLKNTNLINFDKNCYIKTQKNKKSQPFQSGKTIPKNPRFGQKSQVKNLSIFTSRAKNSSSIFLFDQEKTFIEKKQFGQQNELESKLLQPTFRQQTFSTNKNKCNYESEVKPVILDTDRQNIRKNYSPIKKQSQANKKGLKFKNLMELDVKIKKLKGQNKKLRGQIL